MLMDAWSQLSKGYPSEDFESFIIVCARWVTASILSECLACVYADKPPGTRVKEPLEVLQILFGTSYVLENLLYH